MVKYLIDGSTLTAIADAIRNNSPTSWAGQNITPEMMPSAIEDCYYDGYDEGYSDGIRTLRGSFTLKESIERFGMYGTYPCPRGIYTDFGYWNANGEMEWSYEEIDRIEISEDYIDFYSVSGWNKYNDYGCWYGDSDAMPEHLRHAYIEIPEPVQVSQGLYEVLNNLISFENWTPFYLGYDVGWEEGRSLFENLPEPLVLQAQFEPYYDSEFEDYFFAPYDADVLLGYDLISFIDFEVVADSEECHFAIENLTNRPVKVLCYGYLYDDFNDGVEEDCYGVAVIPPFGTATVTITEHNMQGPPQIPIWEDTDIVGVRFI